MSPGMVIRARPVAGYRSAGGLTSAPFRRQENDRHTERDDAEDGPVHRIVRLQFRYLNCGMRFAIHASLFLRVDWSVRFCRPRLDRVRNGGWHQRRRK